MPTLADADVKAAAQFSTTLRKLEGFEFDRLYGHGWECADCTLSSYHPTERVDTSEEMERALKEAGDHGEPWDIVISGYYMPRFSGPDALALLKRLGYEDMPFIVGSGKMWSRLRTPCSCPILKAASWI